MKRANGHGISIIVFFVRIPVQTLISTGLKYSRCGAGHGKFINKTSSFCSVTAKFPPLNDLVLTSKCVVATILETCVKNELYKLSTCKGLTI